MNDEMRKRILSNESFDVSPEEQLKANITRVFERSHKKQLARLTMWVIVGLLIFFGGAWGLRRVDDSRAMLVCVVVMLIGFESTVLIKLWYWTVDARLRITEDIKRLQLLAAGQPLSSASERPTASFPADSGGSIWDRFAVKHLRSCSTVAILVVGMAGGYLFVGPLLVGAGKQVLYESECHARVNDDGTVRMMTRLVYTYYGLSPAETVELKIDAPIRDVIWSDSEGHDLACEITQEGRVFRHTIRLSHAVFRGERVDLRGEWTSSDMVQREGEDYLFKGTGPWRGGLYPEQAITRFPQAKSVFFGLSTSSTVALPVGAHMESFSRHGAQTVIWWQEKGRRVLFFDQPHKVPQDETIQVKYRLLKPPAVTE